MNGYAIKQLRIEHGLTQEKLAEKTDLSARTISDLETGRKDTASPKTLQALAEVLCPEDPNAFFEAILDHPDFEYEKALLEGNIRIPDVMCAPIRKLLDAESGNCVSYVFACMTGYLRGHLGSFDVIAPHTYMIMDAVAPTMRTVKLVEHPGELELMWKGLVANIRALSKLECLPEDISQDAADVVWQLRNSRANNDMDARLAALRAAFFWLYDNWGSIKCEPDAYYALSDISILADNASCSSVCRKHLFYALYNFYSAVVA